MAAALGAAMVLGSGNAVVAKTYEIIGASQFNDDHSQTKINYKFAELVKKYYNGPDEVTFKFYNNYELGTQKEYFNYMAKGVSVDFANVNASHMATYAKRATLIDMPFLFRDFDHWNKVLDSDALQGITEDIKKSADVMVLGYSGGAVRNIFGARPVRNMKELENFTMRVMGAPIQTQMFKALGAAPTVISGKEVYNAMQSGVIEGAENEYPVIFQLKWHEVGPHLALTEHAIGVWPFCFSGKTFRRLPEALQQAVLKAGSEAARYARQEELKAGKAFREKLVSEKLLTIHDFDGREKLQELAEPVKKDFAKSIGAEDILEAITNIR